MDDTAITALLMRTTCSWCQGHLGPCYCQDDGCTYHQCPVRDKTLTLYPSYPVPRFKVDT